MVRVVDRTRAVGTPSPTLTKKDLLGQMCGILGGPENLALWLNTPHPLLDGRTPQSYIDEGHLQVLSYFINAIETGQPS
jgi:hypothetical protein